MSDNDDHPEDAPQTRRQRLAEEESERVAGLVGLKLARDVKVFDPTTGERIRLKAGQRVPDHLQDKVTNPILFQKSSAEDQDDHKDDWKRLTIPGLKTLAENEGVDLGSATRKREIIAVMEESGYGQPKKTKKKGD